MMDYLLNDLFELGKTINTMFDYSPEYRSHAWPEINTYKNKDEYIIVVQVPGMNKNDINISIKDRTIKISGERKKENSKNQILDERFSGNFERNIIVNEQIDSDKINAELKNGLLLVKLPISADSKPKNIAIK